MDKRLPYSTDDVHLIARLESLHHFIVYLQRVFKSTQLF